MGKITPKGESPMTPEEKLLRAIFGEKASDVRDTSLRLPPGDFGTVVEVRGVQPARRRQGQRALQIEREMVERLARDRDDEVAILDRNIYARLKSLILGKTAVKGPRGSRPARSSPKRRWANCPAASGGNWRWNRKLTPRSWKP